MSTPFWHPAFAVERLSSAPLAAAGRVAECTAPEVDDVRSAQLGGFSVGIRIPSVRDRIGRNGHVPRGVGYDAIAVPFFFGGGVEEKPSACPIIGRTAAQAWLNTMG